MSSLPSLHHAIIATVLFCISCSCNLSAAPIWQNHKGGGDDYLIGTIHVGDARLRDLPVAVKKAIDQVDVIVVEFDPSKTSKYQREFLMTKMGMLPPDQTLSSVLSPPVFQKLQKVLFDYDVDIKTVEHFQAWFLSLMLVQLTYEAQGLDAKRGVDVQIVDYARRQGKKIIGLESFEQQLKMFEQLFQRYPDINQDDLILDTLEEIESNRNLPMEMMDAWMTFDMDAFENIYRHTLKKSTFDKAAEQVLLVERNRNWVTTLDPLFGQQSVLVAVGTLHFVGPESLLKILKTKFYG